MLQNLTFQYEKMQVLKDKDAFQVICLKSKLSVLWMLFSWVLSHDLSSSELYANSVDISATQYKDIFHITPPLLFFFHDTSI